MEHNQRLEIVPCTISDANEFVRQYHRHHAPTQGGLFAVAAAHGEQVVAVAIIGRPVGRRNDDGWTAEVTRLASNGHKNACSILYAAAWRAARALGYQRLITFTLPEEGGASPRAAGLKCIGQTKGDTWNRPNSNRPRVDLHPNQIKLKWEVSK